MSENRVVFEDDLTEDKALEYLHERITVHLKQIGMENSSSIALEIYPENPHKMLEMYLACNDTVNYKDLDSFAEGITLDAFYEIVDGYNA